MNSEQVFRPTTQEELDRILREYSGPVQLVAGATDLLVNPDKWARQAALIDLTTVDALIQPPFEKDQGVQFGAAVPYYQLIKSPLIKDHFPMLAEACSQIGSPQIQNRGTVGGNIANASPAGDTLPVLTVLKAQIVVRSAKDSSIKSYTIPQLMAGPGRTVLNRDEYVAAIYLPYYSLQNSFWAFKKVGQRSALAISKATLAVLGWKEGSQLGEIRISTGSVAPRIQLHTQTAAVLSGKVLTEQLIEQAAEQLKAEIAPITDIRSSAEYRKEVTANLLREVLNQLL